MSALRGSRDCLIKFFSSSLKFVLIRFAEASRRPGEGEDEKERGRETAQRGKKAQSPDPREPRCAYSYAY